METKKIINECEKEIQSLSDKIAVLMNAEHENHYIAGKLKSVIIRWIDIGEQKMKIIQLSDFKTIRLQDELKTITYELDKITRLFENAPELATDRLFDVKNMINKTHIKMQDQVING